MDTLESKRKKERKGRGEKCGGSGGVAGSCRELDTADHNMTGLPSTLQT